MTAVRPERETLEAELRAVYEVAPYPAILAAAEYLAALAVAPDARLADPSAATRELDQTAGTQPDLDARLAEALEVIRGVGALVATSACLKRPALKTEPWDGPCGKCAPCRARAAYYDADGKPRLAAAREETT
jgi:hypothetical protein